MSEEEEITEDEIIELMDDDGNVIKFKLMDVTEYKGEKYAFLLAAEPNSEIAEDEIAVFRLNEAEQVLEPVESDELMQEIYDFYLQETEEEDDGGEN